MLLDSSDDFSKGDLPNSDILDFCFEKDFLFSDILINQISPLKLEQTNPPQFFGFAHSFGKLNIEAST